MTISRRDFVKTSVLGAVATGVGARAAIPETLAENSLQGHASQSDAPKRPIIICAHNGYAYVEAAYTFLKGGGDTLEAGVRVVKGPEDDPNDDSVGLGGLPNEEGVVELDSCCMHGPTRRAGSVGGVRNIKNVSMAAKAVMEHTGHVMGSNSIPTATGGDRAWPIRTGIPPLSSQNRKPIFGANGFSSCSSVPPISASSRSFKWRPCGEFYFRPLAPFTARFSMRRERCRASPPPAGWRSNCPAGVAILPSSAQAAIPTRT